MNLENALRRSQLTVSQLIRRTPLDVTRLDGADETARERHYQNGYDQVDNLAQRLEAQTGFTLPGADVLDFGCGLGRNVLPLAERCAHVYGLDISPAGLATGEREAARRNLENIDWMLADRLPEMAGRYDLVVSFFVFQHIPTREGERLFAVLLDGLRPGGAGALHVPLAPKFRGSMRKYVYDRMNGYSLNRLAELLTGAGITEWHCRAHRRPLPGSDVYTFQDLTIIFRKP